MSASTYVVPQVLVFQEFNVVPSEITAPLRAHVSGPHAYLLRHSEASEKSLGDLGPYDPAVDTAYSWPGRPAGAIVDPTYTKLFVDGARLEYFADLIGADATVAPVAGKPNRVRLDDATDGFIAHGVAYPRLAALYDRDVQVGDRVKVRGVASSTSYELDTYVLGFAADQVAAVTGTATADLGNGTTQSAASVVTQVGGDSNCNTLVADLTDYVSYRDGVLVDTYTVTVVSGSIGGDLRTALLRITSASGLDDVDSVAPEDVDVFLTVGRRDLQLKFTCGGHSNASLSTDDLVPGQQWTVVVHDDYKTINAAAAGTYTGTRDATYVVEVTRGGLFADTLKPQISVTTDVGGDRSGPTAVAALGTAYPVGTKGITVTFSGSSSPTGLRKGDKYYISATAAADGRFGTLILGHNLPTAIQTASDLDLHLSLEVDLEVDPRRLGFEPTANWSQTALELSVTSGMVAYDPSFTDQGVPVAVPVASGELFVEYRAWRQDLVDDVGSISDVGLLDQVPGALSPDNPLKWGVYSALLNSNGTAVKYSAVADPNSLDAWADVVALLVGRDDVYNLVPLTHTKAVLDLFAAHCGAQSSAENGRWRGMFLALQATPQSPIVSADTSSDGNVVLATVADDPDSTVVAYTLLTATSANGLFRASGVRAGDVVRTSYSTAWGEDTWQEYLVDSVVSEDTLKLVSGPPSAIASPIRVEVWHQATKSEQATAIGAVAASYGSRRVKAVWPDTIDSGGTTLDGYYLCCALAGLRSGVVPHQGLTNVAIAGFDDVSRSTKYFNADQLNTMAAAGVWVVTQDAAGVVKTRHARTTDVSDINHVSEMVTTNLDSISYLFQSRLRPFIGVTNVTPTAIARMHIELASAIEFLKQSGFTDSLGAQLIDATIVRLSPHALLRDRVTGIVSVELPVEMDNIELYIVV